MDYGLIGEKLGHSFSKTVHAKLTDYEYELKEIAKCDLEEFLSKAEFKAINVTIPYKQTVIPFLYKMDEVAKKIGAVNTIVNRNGRLYGYNTDYFGMLALIKHSKIDLNGKKVLILGSGGTSKTAYAVAESLAAREIYRVSRVGGDGLITYDEVESRHLDAEIIINTTPCGMLPNLNSMAIDIDKFNCLTGVLDAVYNPINTKLVLKAKKRSIPAEGGLYMLVAQAVFAAEKFIDTSFDTAVIDKIYNELYLGKRNLVLIGMPGSGKSTIGKAVAKLLNKEFSDTDSLIVKKEGTSIPEIFKNQGEKYFRKTETEVIAEVSAFQNKVIATGGGAVLNPENTELLKANGCVVFIDRPIEQIEATSDRPLSSNREDLKKRYQERYDIYFNASDIVIKADKSLEENTELVKEAFLNENTCN